MLLMAVNAETGPATRTGADAAPGLLELLPAEETVRELQGADGGRFVLTDQRVIYTGGEASEAVFSSARLEDVTSVAMERRARERRSAVWGVVGLIAAIGVWQVTYSGTVGLIAGGVVGLISFALLADYWFRVPGVVLRFLTAGGGVAGPVDGGGVRGSEEFAAAAELARQEARERRAAMLHPRFSHAAMTGNGSEPPGQAPGGQSRDWPRFPSV